MVKIDKTKSNCTACTLLCEVYTNNLDEYYSEEIKEYENVLEDIAGFLLRNDIFTAWQHLLRSSLFKEAFGTIEEETSDYVIVIPNSPK